MARRNDSLSSTPRPWLRPAYEPTPVPVSPPQYVTATGASEKRDPALKYSSEFEAAAEKWHVPFQLLEVIAKHESGLNPVAQPKDSDGEPISSAIGFCQTIKATVDQYNKANGTHLEHPTLKQLKAGYDARKASVADPGTSLDVGAWLLSTVAKRYEQNGLPIDWRNPRDVGLVLLAYGGGSELVPQIAGKMLKKMDRDAITVANVIAVASKAYPDKEGYNNGNGFLSDPALAKHIRKELKELAGLGAFAGAVHDSEIIPDPKLVSNDDEPAAESGFGFGAAIAAILTMILGAHLIVGEEEEDAPTRKQLQKRIDKLTHAYDANVLHGRTIDDDASDLWTQALAKWNRRLQQDLDEDERHAWDTSLTWFASAFKRGGVSAGVEPMVDCVERGERFSSGAEGATSAQIVDQVKATNAKLTSVVEQLDAQTLTPGSFVNALDPVTMIPTMEARRRVLAMKDELKNIVGIGQTLIDYVSGQAVREDKGARLKQISTDYQRSAKALLDECSDIARFLRDATFAGILKQGIKDAAGAVAELVADAANWVGETIREAVEEGAGHFTESINLSGVAALFGALGIAYLASRGSSRK